MTRPGPSVSGNGEAADAALREAFAAEVSTRLPLMTVAGAAVGAEGDVASARELARHAHTLASSAVVLGEDLAAQHARRCELALEPHVHDGAPPVPRAVVQTALEELATLSILLAPWLMGGDEDAD